MSTAESEHGQRQAHDGPLAEFVALRQEIDRRSNMQHNLFALQLTASAVIFSFALSRIGRSGFLLIIPVSTFMLCARYVDQMYGIQNAGRYIRQVLDSRVPGGLGWEGWIRAKGDSRKAAQFSQARRVVALIVTFPAIAVGALAWSAPNVFWPVHRLAADARSALIVTWVLGLAATIGATQMIWRALRLARPQSGN
jgi:hypothetical protein